MGEPEKPKANQPEKPKAERKAKRGARSPKGAPSKGKASTKSSRAKGVPKDQKKGAGAVREGSKTAQVVAMLQRKNGATLGGEHDRDAPLREWISLESPGKSGRQPGDPTAGGDAMPDHGGNRGPAPTGPGGTEASGGAEVVHNDDTSMRVLSLDRDADISPERTGVFTSGLVWICQERRIALYFTGCKHAGENLAEVLAGPPINYQFNTKIDPCLLPGRARRDLHGP